MFWDHFSGRQLLRCVAKGSLDVMKYQSIEYCIFYKGRSLQWRASSRTWHEVSFIVQTINSAGLLRGISEGVLRKERQVWFHGESGKSIDPGMFYSGRAVEIRWQWRCHIVKDIESGSTVLFLPGNNAKATGTRHVILVVQAFYFPKWTLYSLWHGEVYRYI